jgi:hypothetical protein
MLFSGSSIKIDQLWGINFGGGTSANAMQERIPDDE